MKAKKEGYWTLSKPKLTKLTSESKKKRLLHSNNQIESI
jgi:hypothetical protein